jgi:hypothetical protein
MLLMVDLLVSCLTTMIAFSWQRQNFKKNQPEQAEGSMLVVTVK